MNEGEGAFYGPKLEYTLFDARHRLHRFRRYLGG
jgi:threonyl-tRNA synthetase